MMPNKTIYVKDTDVPLFEQAQELLGESVSSMFADFLKQRVGNIDPGERMRELTNLIVRKRAAARKERILPRYIDGVYAEAAAHSKKALRCLRSGDIKKAKAWYYAANVYHERAERDAKQTRELAEKLQALLEA